MIDFFTPLNLFCSEFPSWSFSNIGGNSYLIACNFINQSQMINFNPDDDAINVDLNPKALIPFFDNEVVTINYINGIVTFTTLDAIYTLDGINETCSRENC